MIMQTGGGNKPHQDDCYPEKYPRQSGNGGGTVNFSCSPGEGFKKRIRRRRN